MPFREWLLELRLRSKDIQTPVFFAITFSSILWTMPCFGCLTLICLNRLCDGIICGWYSKVSSKSRIELPHNILCTHLAQLCHDKIIGLLELISEPCSIIPHFAVDRHSFVNVREHPQYCARQKLRRGESASIHKLSQNLPTQDKACQPKNQKRCATNTTSCKNYARTS